MHHLSSNSQWFKAPDLMFNNSVTKTEYVSCNLRKNSNANVNLNKIDHEVLVLTSAKATINGRCYSLLNKLIRHLEWILKLKGGWIL